MRSFSVPAGFLSGLRLGLFLALFGTGLNLSSAEPNPPAPEFNLAGSDPRAVAVADQVMTALGGRKAWDETHYITWRFFGGRRHVWDKYTGRLRYEDKGLVVLMNLNTTSGRAWQDGVEITNADSLADMLRRAQGAWVNDSYWLLMPYKLKDSGVTLLDLGVGQDSQGNACDVLQLTFKNVGLTPDNKYHILVDRSTHLVSEWTYWKDAAVDEPRSLGPWRDWQRYGKIMLAPNHGERQHTEIGVFRTLPDHVFETPAPFVLADYQ